MNQYLKAGFQLPEGADFEASAQELLYDHGVIFDVRRESVISADSKLSYDDRVMLINDDLDIPIGLVSTSYKVIENAPIFESFLQAVVEADIDTSDVRILPTSSDYGARTLVKFRFVNQALTLPFDDSPIAYELSVSNSFDGSSSYMTRVAGFRLVCANGMMMAKTLGQQAHFHRSELNVHDTSRDMIRMLHMFQNADKYWQAMADIKIGEEEVEHAIRKYFRYGPTVDVMNYTSSTACAHVVRSWRMYSEVMGSNLYSLYQALTDFVSNKTYKTETHATGLGFNEDRLQKFLNSYPGFKQAANDAQRALAA